MNIEGGVLLSQSGSSHRSVGGTISQVGKAASNRACSSYGHPPNARPHPSSGVSLQSHYFILPTLNILKTS